jgi:uncharacterized protein
LDWAHWMKSQQTGCKSVFALGESLGASILIQAAAVEPSAFAAIVAECPYADLRNIAVYRVNQQILRQLRQVPTWMSQTAAKSIVSGGLLYTKARYNLNLNEASPLTAIRQSKTPTLLIHGLMDENTPPEHSSRLADASRRSATLWLVPAAGHTGASSAAPAEFRKRVFAWFAQHN